MLSALKKGIKTLIAVYSFIAISGCERKVETEEVLMPLTKVQSESLFKRATEVKPVGKPVIEVIGGEEEQEGEAARISAQVFRLSLVSEGKAEKKRRTVYISVECTGECRKLVQNPRDPNSCGVESGCDPTATGGCTPLVCDKERCAAKSCRKTSTARIPVDLTGVH